MSSPGMAPSSVRCAVAAILASLSLACGCMVTETPDGNSVPPSDYAAPEKIRENLRKLGEEDLPPPVCDAIFWELRQADRAAVPYLVEALKDESPVRRSRAVIALGLFQGPDIVKHIAPLLRDPVPHVCLAAAAALVRHGYRDGVPVLIGGLRHENTRVREWCNEQLFQATGVHLGFHASDPIDRREHAVRNWEEWWRTKGATAPLNAEER